MLELMPGSPFNDRKNDGTQKMMLNQKYGLDKPVMVRFFNYIKICSPAILACLFDSEEHAGGGYAGASF